MAYQQTWRQFIHSTKLIKYFAIILTEFSSETILSSCLANFATSCSTFIFVLVFLANFSSIFLQQQNQHGCLAPDSHVGRRLPAAKKVGNSVQAFSNFSHAQRLALRAFNSGQTSKLK
jgi:hypothetical protein